MRSTTRDFLTAAQVTFHVFRVYSLNLTYLPFYRLYSDPEGPSTLGLGPWVLGNKSDSAGFGQVYAFQVLGPLG